MINHRVLNFIATTLLTASVMVAVARYLHPATFSVASYSLLLAISVLLLLWLTLRRS